MAIVRKLCMPQFGHVQIFIEFEDGGSSRRSLKRVVAVGVTGPKAGRHKVSAKQEQILADPSQIDQQITIFSDTHVNAYVAEHNKYDYLYNPSGIIT